MFFQGSGFCVFEGKCSFRRDGLECIATEEDLIEICEDCDQPIPKGEDCDCWMKLDVLST